MSITVNFDDDSDDPHYDDPWLFCVVWSYMGEDGIIKSVTQTESKEEFNKRKEEYRNSRKHQEICIKLMNEYTDLI